jgi:hypothetical protein
MQRESATMAMAEPRATVMIKVECAETQTNASQRQAKQQNEKEKGAAFEENSAQEEEEGGEEGGVMVVREERRVVKEEREKVVRSPSQSQSGRSKRPLSDCLGTWRRLSQPTLASVSPWRSSFCLVSYLLRTLI